jgi:hypothetical protein
MQLFSHLKSKVFYLPFGIVFLYKFFIVLHDFSFFDYGIFASCLLFLILSIGYTGIFLLAFTRKQISVPIKASRAWLWSLTIATIGLIAPSIIFNPQGIYPWDRLPLYLSGGVRAIKLDLYQALETKPEIILFGSSRAHIMPTSYLEKQYGLPAFNWSVEGGGPVDNLIIYNYLAARKQTPQILIIEISPVLMSPGWQDRTPFEFIPYQSADIMWKYSGTYFKNLLKYQNFAEAWFTFFRIYKIPSGYFLADGTEKPNLTTDSTDEYRNKVSLDAPRMEAILNCKQLLPDGIEATNQLMETLPQDVGVVMYVSPLNYDFLKTLDWNAQDYQFCAKLLDSYMQTVREKHPNVFYRNLLMYEPISKLGMDGFADIEHIRTSQLGKKVLDALSPEIRKAIKWTHEFTK